jgi:antitoxin (DNA-binding transcriptional repressor) of toxin-antitoxin stability system
MTYRVDIAEAPHRLIDLIRAAKQGEQVVITENQLAIIQLVPIDQPAPRPTFGSARGKIHIHDDFDAPLEDFEEYMP